MKKQSSRRRSASMPPIPVRHQFDHDVPTVIHHPEEKMTALGRWTHHVLQDPRKLSTWAIVIGLGVVVAVVGWNVATGGRSRTSEVWSKLETAKKAEDRVEIAKENPKSPAATWALLQAANRVFRGRDQATCPITRTWPCPISSKALKLYDQVARGARTIRSRPGRPSWARRDRSRLRNDLSKAIEQYELVVKNWPASAEAEQAKELAEALQKPEAAAFYKELYAYSPTKVTLPASRLGEA